MTSSRINKARSLRKRIRLVLFFFWGLTLAWLLTSMKAKDFDPELGVSSASVTVVKTKQGMQFIPQGRRDSTGLVFMAGALVDPDAYIPFARSLADEGYTTVIVYTPMRFPSYPSFTRKAKRRARAFMNDFTDVEWVVGGHSRGGRMASEMVSENPGSYAGLLLIGTSHPREVDLSNQHLPVLKISGSLDGLASPEEIEQFAINLPQETKFVMIEGGNHAQFGWYGRQLGDKKATISRNEQQQQTVKAALSFLESIASEIPQEASH